ncbi:MAG: hypothetical protein HZB16_23420 [Armatimonadetes bacterium]|nr:hypothetical protein [Armatimonadota bacterium]
MSTGRWRPFVLLATLALSALALRTVAQEAAKPKAAQSNASLLTADRAVIDATNAVAKPGKTTAAPTAEQAVAAAPQGFVPPDLGNYQVTVFADGVGLVRRVEDIDLSVGRNEFAVSEVARRIDSGSARLRPLDDPNRFVVLEQSGGAPRDAKQLLNAAVGRDIRVRDGDYTVSGKLVSVDDEGVILAADGEVHVHPKGQVILPKEAALPDLTPKLSWMLDTERAGKAPAEITYLTHGLTWSADYAVTVLPQGQLVSFDAWVNLDNTCGVDFDNVGFIFAGDAALPTPPAPAAGAAPNAVPMESAAGKRFYLPRRASLANGSARRYQLAQATAARGALRYVATVGPEGLQGLRSAVRLVNNGAAGLGVPLPPGPVRIYAPDALGRLQLVGRQTLATVSPDAPFTFELGGDAPEGLTATVETANDGGALRRTVRLRNQRAEDAAVTVVEKRAAGWQFVSASSTFSPVSGGQSSTEVTVPAGGAVEVRYQIQLPGAPTTGARGRAGGA